MIPFLTPMIGAAAAYFLNRGSRLRRARTAALDDLQLHDRAEALFGVDDPLVDQLRAHARESAKSYNARRGASQKRAYAWLSLAAILVTSVVLGTVAVSLKVENHWVLIGSGVVGGVVGILVEAGLEKLMIRQALRQIPTSPARGIGDQV